MKAFIELGYAAYYAGEQPDDCPFEAGTKMHDAWMDGWFEAFTNFNQSEKGDVE